MQQHYYAAILAGGLGTRFWPKSRASFPKQFLDILNLGETLIQSTYKRYSNFIPAENIFVITSDEYVDIIKKQLPEIPVENILAEPSRKNTAPCVAYISFKLLEKDPSACLIVAPSDHLVTDNKTFEE
ncbi:MAG TPA: sugar phosphate nucleotidyltransferase [Parafilimonas sp.]|nr:sugar phosphate nucleotidyltransferase [Parafilimonas sp.]